MHTTHSGAPLPHVVLVGRPSLDGRLTLGRHQRLLDPAVGARWATIQQDVFTGRDAEIDTTAVLQGSGSFVDVDAEPPSWPPARLSEPELHRDHLPVAAPAWFVVADSRGRVDWQFTGDDAMPLLVLVCDATPLGYLQRLRDLGVPYLIAGSERVDPRRALERLHGIGVRRVALDSGGTFNASFLRAGLVDEVDVLVLPGLVGGAGVPTLVDGPELDAEADPIRLQLLGVETEQDTVRLRYRVLR